MLKDVGGFEGLSDQQISLLTDRAAVRSYSKGAIIVNEGDEGTSLFVIMSGSVKTFLSDENGKEVVLSTQGAGEYFGDLALFDDEPRSASVMALEPCKVMIITKAALREAIKEDPDIGFSLLHGLAKRVRILTDDLHELPAELVGDSAFMDVVIYRVIEAHRSKLHAGTSFAVGDVSLGTEVFTVGYPLGWGPTMAFGRLGNTNVFLQTVDTRLLQADLSSCSGNSGGGLFNAQGEVIGIVHAIIRTEKEEAQAHCSRLTFAIPGILAERIVNVNYTTAL